MTIGNKSHDMSASDAPVVPNSGPREETIMSALDEDDLVIADVSRDDAWLIVPATEAPALSEWR